MSVVIKVRRKGTTACFMRQPGLWGGPIFLCLFGAMQSGSAFSVPMRQNVTSFPLGLFQPIITPPNPRRAVLKKAEFFF